MENFKVKQGVDVDTTTDSYVPVGAIIPIMSTTVPEGWLACDGSNFSSAIYPELANILGDRYGTHVGILYYLPNLNGKYPYILSGTGNSNSSTKSTNTDSNTMTGGSLDHSHSTGNTGENHQHNWGNAHNKSGPTNVAMNSGPTNASGQGHYHTVSVGGATSGVYAWHSHGTNNVAGSPGANTTEMSRLINGHSHDSTHSHGSWEVKNMKVYYIIKC